ncbi:MAG TPA: phosphoribosyltransferase family protein, partial [Paludibacteraceae bacterium]|nr:phosphoribosyltransferase family protein [Paludibacteraceae bacterium]
MKKVQILDKKFALSIPEKKIQEAIKTISEQINTDFKNRNPLFVSILNGSFMFASDLIKQITIPSEITFIKVASYTNTQSTGVVTEIFGLDHDVE